MGWQHETHNIGLAAAMSKNLFLKRRGHLYTIFCIDIQSEAGGLLISNGFSQLMY